MDAKEFGSIVMEELAFEPNGQQTQLIAALSLFCSRGWAANGVFVLNGYAGTGKTSVVGALVKALRRVNVPTVLLAPTGRAAKVFSRMAGHPAYTIHRMIYRSATSGGGMGYGGGLTVNENRYRNTIFIVDEASMIGDGTAGDPYSQSLLDDLVQYVYSSEGCRLILLGDTAQLPPVGCTESPAMQPKRLKALGLRVTRATMTQTVRQTRNSGILYNATWLRRAMLSDPLPEPQLTLEPFADVKAVSGEDLPDEIEKAYSHYGIEDTMLITRSNQRATQYNLAIRSRILEKTEMLTGGELIMIARNNYHWTTKVPGIDFIANGDIARVEKVYGTEERGGLKFADVRLRLIDRETEIDVKLILDSLVSDTPALDAAGMQRLVDLCVNDRERFSDSTPMSTRMRTLRSDPYFNALQVKYGYAVTCHKAQGGQWSSVFVDMGYIPPESQGIDFYRWLYTSTTRAVKELNYINPAIKVND